MSKMALLNHFIPRAASLRLVHRYRFWHQESRIMTVAFINLDFKQFDQLPTEKLQKIFETIQVGVYCYEGSVNKFMYDDKGATAIAVFGLPPICNFDDSARAVYASLRVQSHLKRSLGIKANVGVTAGRVFCGLLGSGGSGCEYGVLGDLVNLAARLMQHAGKPKSKGGLGERGGVVLVSRQIQRQCEDCRNLKFEKLMPISVKGKTNKIEVYRPRLVAVRGETVIYRSSYNVGWEDEYSQVINPIKSMIYGQGQVKGNIFSVEGHHLHGTTHFAREIMARLRKFVYIVAGSGVKFEETQLVVWQALMVRIVRECHLLHGDPEGFKSSIWRFLQDTGKGDMLKHDQMNAISFFVFFSLALHDSFVYMYKRTKNGESRRGREKKETAGRPTCGWLTLY